MEGYFAYDTVTKKVIGKYSKQWTSIKFYAKVFPNYEDCHLFLFQNGFKADNFEIIELKFLNTVP